MLLKTLYQEKAHPERVLDLCAAPGGKSTLLAARLPNSFIVSNEVIKNRVTILAENMSKWGCLNAAVTHNDPADFKKLPGFFDLLVVDAPCSGSGLFRKDERAIDEWSEENVAHCSLRQQRILADVLPSLKTGGHLIYSTCSYSVAEDETICDWLVNEMGIQPVSIPVDPSWGIVETLSPDCQVPGYRFYPDKIKGEGFFLACFQQMNEVDEKEYYPGKMPAPSKAETQLVNLWLNTPDHFYLFKQKETIIALPEKWKNEFATSAKCAACTQRRRGYWYHKGQRSCTASRICFIWPSYITVYP